MVRLRFNAMPLYFAYGSNMLVERITAATRVPAAVLKGVARLDGYQLTFGKLSIRSNGGRSGKGDIVEHPDGAVYGVLYEVPDFEALDRVEGVSSGDYRRVMVKLSSAEHGEVEAAVYVAVKTGEALRPYHWYKGLVLAGAEQHGLPTDYVEDYIRSISSIPDAGGEEFADFQEARSILEPLGYWRENSE
ncbi:gamma-glutamylcyclotransferase [Haloferula sp. BvORR071]|uniref:gamma-glutamylcyclotransferase n=1 Tax=Haloferula sp. BvORR071 TaxID=1396141 RepID=UPI0006975357|nr:gamma-glutamylcyclotransferase [Haloferula sp. BvORR071]